MSRQWPRSLMVLSYGYSDNVGDNAILEAILEMAAAQGVEKVSALDFGADSAAVVLPANLKVSRISGINGFKLLAGLVRAKGVLLGGGGILQHNSSYYNLYYFLLLAFVAILLRKPLFVFRVGIADIRPSSARFLMRFIFKRARSVSVRDYSSQRRAIDQIGYDCPIDVQPDPAFLRSFHRANVARDLEELAGSPFVLVALRPPIDTNPGVRPKKKYSKDKLELAAKEVFPELRFLLDDIKRVTGMTRVVFFACQYPRDAILSACLVRLFDAPADENQVIDRQCNFDELLFLASRSSLVMTNRYHACIAAIRQKTPLIAINNFKIDSLVNEYSDQKVIGTDVAGYLHSPVERERVREFLDAL